jgi:hypothetical protein
MPLTKTVKKGSTPATIYEVDFKDDSSLQSFVDGRYATRESHRFTLERQWFENVAQYLGYQNHHWDRVSGKLSIDNAPPWRSRIVINRLKGIVQKLVSKAVRAQPHWESLPATSELQDQMISIVSTKVLRYYWRSLDMDRMMVDAFHWIGTCGNVFLSVWWDPQKSTEFKLDQSDLDSLPEEFRNDPAFKDILKPGQTIAIGDVSVEVNPPFEVDPDPDALDMECASHVIHSKLRSLTYLRDRYKKAKKINPADSDQETLTSFYTRRLQTMAGPTSGSSGVAVANEEQNHAAICHTLYVNPTKKYPKGVYAVVAGGIVLEKRFDLPNPFKRAPFVHLKEMHVPGRFWGSCSLEQSRPLQAAYNRSRNQQIESRNLMARPKWLVAKGSLSNDLGITNQPGDIVEYNPPFRPEAWTPPPLPEYVFRIEEALLKDMEDISSIHEVTQARAPSGVRSGVAIAQLQEQDDQALAPTFMVASKQISKLGSWLLQLVAENVEEDRMLKVVGENRGVESFLLTGGALFGDNQGTPGVNYFDVEVQMGSQLPLSKQARSQFVLDLVNAGILDRVQDRKKIMELLELGHEEGALTEDQMDKQAAIRENVEMMQGVFSEPNSWDNDEEHLRQHQLWRKQPQYSQALQENPQLNEIFDQHDAGHQIRINALLQQEQLAQAGQLPQGGPPAPEEEQFAPEGEQGF